jgi:hypothetical protein
MARKTKTLRFSVRLKDIGPESKKKLMGIGMNENLDMLVQELEFTDKGGRGFDSPMFALTVMEKQEELCKKVVECVVEEVHAKRKAKKQTVA